MLTGLLGLLIVTADIAAVATILKSDPEIRAMFHGISWFPRLRSPMNDAGLSPSLEISDPLLGSPVQEFVDLGGADKVVFR